MQVECPPGQFKNPSTGECLLCPVGTYTAQPGATGACIPCDYHPTQGVASEMGSTTCVPCPPMSGRALGTGGIDSSKECRCIPGSYLDADEGACLPCPVGAICEGGFSPPYANSMFFGEVISHGIEIVPEVAPETSTNTASTSNDGGDDMLGYSVAFWACPGGSCRSNVCTEYCVPGTICEGGLSSPSSVF